MHIYVGMTMSQDIFTNSSQPRASSGCCIIGLIIAIIAALLYPLRFIVVGLWRLGPHIIKFLYYFLAWPILAVEYAWRRGGGWRIIAVIFGVLFTLAYGVISLAGMSAGDASGTSPSVAITTASTSTPTRLITATVMADTPIASPIPSPTTAPAPPTQTVAVPAATATDVPAATATDVPAATATDVPAATAITQAGGDTTTGLRSSAQVIDPAWVQVNVVRVADGDTITVNYNGVNRQVRLIGVDTPETVDPRKPVQCFGVEASNYTKSQLNKQTVYLEFDESQGITDKYNRMLAFVRRADGSLFNYDVIANGYGFEYTYQNNPYRYQSEFIAAARDARENGRGLWAASTCNGVTGSATTSTSGASSAQDQGATIATAAPVLTAADEAAPCQVNQIKGNLNSMIYHVPGGASYAKTKSNVECFDSEAAAAAAGYRKAKR
jgi:endonuclease YncB( thermonuclease family)